MISDEEKLRICELEAFRKEVRDQLNPAAPKSRRERIWAALNSNFGMWLVSAVLVSGLGTAYTRYSSQKEDDRKLNELKQVEARKLIEARERLRLEVAFRVSTTIAQLAVLHRGAALEQGATASVTGVDRALNELRLPRTDGNPPLFAEYKTYTSIALLAELRRLSEDGERRILKSVMTRTSRVVASPLSAQGKKPMSIAGEILEYTKPVVSDTGFPYTDCEEKMPFC